MPYARISDYLLETLNIQGNINFPKNVTDLSEEGGKEIPIETI